MLTARTLPKIWCQVDDCQSTCKWENILRAGVHHTVAMCEVHGIVALQLNNVMLRPFPFAMSQAKKAEQPRGKRSPDDLPCVRCGSKRANASCTFWLCKPCCAQLRLQCGVGEHRDHGEARYADVEPYNHSDLRIADAVIEPMQPVGRDGPAASTHDDDGTLVHASCAHYGGDGVKKNAFDIYISIPPATTRLHLRDFTTDAKRALGLSGMDMRRLSFDAAGEMPAFAADGASPLDMDDLNGVATWNVYIIVRDYKAHRHGEDDNTEGRVKKRKMDDVGAGASKKSKRQAGI